jgi:hypothetical protein
VKIFSESRKIRRLFIEPSLCATGTQRKLPDILICDSRSVIGVVELKYTPRGIPKTTKDLNTLAFTIEHRKSLTIANERFRGPTRDPKSYFLAEDAVLCWAGIYTGQRLHLKMNPDVESRFLQLDALTSFDSWPKIFVEGNHVA